MGCREPATASVAPTPPSFKDLLLNAPLTLGATNTRDAYFTLHLAVDGSALFISEGSSFGMHTSIGFAEWAQDRWVIDLPTGYYQRHLELSESPSGMVLRIVSEVTNGHAREPALVPVSVGTQCDVASWIRKRPVDCTWEQKVALALRGCQSGVQQLREYALGPPKSICSRPTSTTLASCVRREQEVSRALLPSTE